MYVCLHFKTLSLLLKTFFFLKEESFLPFNKKIPIPTEWSKAFKIKSVVTFLLPGQKSTLQLQQRLLSFQRFFSVKEKPKV